MKTQVFESNSLYLFFLPLGMDGVDVYHQFAPYLRTNYHTPFDTQILTPVQPADLLIFDYVQNYFRQPNHPQWVQLCESLAGSGLVVVVMAGLEPNQRQAVSRYFLRSGRTVKTWDLNYWGYYSHLSKGIARDPVMMKLALIQYLYEHSQQLADSSVCALVLVDRPQELRRWQHYLSNYQFKSQADYSCLSLWLGHAQHIPQHIFVLTEQSDTSKRLRTLPATWLAQAHIYFPAAAQQKPSFKHLKRLWRKIKSTVLASLVTFYIPILK